MDKLSLDKLSLEKRHANDDRDARAVSQRKLARAKNKKAVAKEFPMKCQKCNMDVESHADLVEHQKEFRHCYCPYCNCDVANMNRLMGHYKKVHHMKDTTKQGAGSDDAEEGEEGDESEMNVDEDEGESGNENLLGGLEAELKKPSRFATGT